MHYNVEAGDIDLLTYIKNPEVFDIKDGHVMNPTGPGLGIEIDEDMVRKIAKETSPWQPLEFTGMLWRFHEKKSFITDNRTGPDGSIREW